MNDREKVIEDLNIAKHILISLQMSSHEMHIKIGQAISAAINLLQEQPEVVLCKDCKYYDPEYVDEECRLLNDFTTEPNWYCADGERR